jgi:predicted nucleic acid-binding protein
MYLIDTNVISELRKGRRANPGVRAFFFEVTQAEQPLFLSVVTIGELRRGVELIRHRGDTDQARRLEAWLTDLLLHYSDHLLDINADVCQTWGWLRVPHHDSCFLENAIDKLIAATALVHDLILVTRNERDFRLPGLRLLNPFSA